MTSPKPTLFLSIQPRYVDRILSGEKTVELRRVPPRVETPVPVLIYASSPRRRLEASATASSILCADLPALWDAVGPLAGVSRREFDEYFAGRCRGVAIVLARVRRIRDSVSLASLRRSVAGFQPPQSFRYLGSADLVRVRALC